MEDAEDAKEEVKFFLSVLRVLRGFAVNSL